MKVELSFFSWFAYALFTGSSVYLLFGNNSLGTLIGAAFLLAFIILGGLDFVLSSGKSTFA